MKNWFDGLLVTLLIYNAEGMDSRGYYNMTMNMWNPLSYIYLILCIPEVYIKMRKHNKMVKARMLLKN